MKGGEEFREGNTRGAGLLDRTLAVGDEGRDGEGHGDAVVVVSLDLRTPGRSPVNHQAIFSLLGMDPGFRVEKIRRQTNRDFISAQRR